MNIIHFCMDFFFKVLFEFLLANYIEPHLLKPQVILTSNEKFNWTQKTDDHLNETLEMRFSIDVWLGTFEISWVIEIAHRHMEIECVVWFIERGKRFQEQFSHWMMQVSSEWCLKRRLKPFWLVEKIQNWTRQDFIFRSPSLNSRRSNNIFGKQS